MGVIEAPFTIEEVIDNSLFNFNKSATKCERFSKIGYEKKNQS